MTKIILAFLVHVATVLADSPPEKTGIKNNLRSPEEQQKAVLELLENASARFTQKPILKLANRDKKKDESHEWKYPRS